MTPPAPPQTKTQMSDMDLILYLVSLMPSALYASSKCVPEAWPTLKLKHSFVKPAVEQFAVLYPKSLGGEGRLVKDHISLSLRVVLWHFRKCAWKAGCLGYC